MATRLEQTIEMIRAGLQEEARLNLERQGAVRTGFLRDNTNVIIQGEDDFVVEFPDYGVFINDGTSRVAARPFYSELVETGNAEGSYEDEIEDMLETAFNQDVEELNDIQF